MPVLRRIVPFLILIGFTIGLSTHLAAASQMRALVRWVDDGDTVVLEGGGRVRYVGVNTPEIAHGDEPGEPFAEEARTYNRKLVLGRTVTLEIGERQYDQYGRMLADVFLKDGTFVNGELVRHGYAHLLRGQTQLRYWERLLKLQRQAIREKRGIWTLPAVDPEEYYLGNKRSWVFHRPHCPFGRKTAGRNRVRFRDRYDALYLGFSPGRRCKP